jgi:hypothetical protein
MGCLPPVAIVHPCAMTDPAEAQRLVAVAVAMALHGRINVLVTAGAMPQHMAPAAEMGGRPGRPVRDLSGQTAGALG